MGRRFRNVISAQLLVSAVCVATALADQTVVYQNGNSGYAGEVDTEVGALYPDYFRNDGGMDTVYCGGGSDHQILLRFDGIPVGATIASATLTLQTGTGAGSGTGDPFYRMLMSWSNTATYNSLGNGVQSNGVEASSVASFQAPSIVNSGPISFDVTADVQAWANGQANYGWVVKDRRINNCRDHAI